MNNSNEIILPDIQQTKPNIQIPINQVGVSNVDIPFMLENKLGGYNDLIAKVSMKVSLKEDKKGISMSRMILSLKEFLRKPLKHFLIKDILFKLQENLESDNSYISFKFKLPIIKKSPISDNEFPIYYKCVFEGQMYNNEFRFFQKIILQYLSACPCSAELSKDLINKGFDMGFPHAQRSFAHITIEAKDPNYIWLEEIIEMVESVIKTIPYPIVKRIDEQEIAKIASQNPLFVEDAIRLISDKLDNCEKIHDWIVKCIHEESIHTSEAIAINWKGIEGGFDGRYYL